VSKPTRRQLEILEYMRRYQDEHGVPPTLKEICLQFRFASSNAAHSHLSYLCKKGLVVHRGPRLARNYVARKAEGGSP
jgi:repressor LexA